MARLYTKVPRSTFWLLPEGVAEIGEGAERFTTEVGAFYIGTTPITNAQYRAFAAEFEPAETSPGPEHPAVGVSFGDALAYCDWYAELSGKPIRLPTEVEWEYACRGGTRGPTFYGDGEADHFVCDATSSSGRSAEVEGRRRNPFGLYDMLGLVWEWTSSLYAPYPARPGDGRDERASAGPRVVRGGSFRTPRGELGSGVRRGLAPELRADDIGFRIVRSL